MFNNTCVIFSRYYVIPLNSGLSACYVDCLTENTIGCMQHHIIIIKHDFTTNNAIL